MFASRGNSDRAGRAYITVLYDTIQYYTILFYTRRLYLRLVHPRIILYTNCVPAALSSRAFIVTVISTASIHARITRQTCHVIWILNISKLERGTLISRKHKRSRLEIFLYGLIWLNIADSYISQFLIKISKLKKKYFFSQNKKLEWLFYRINVYSYSK